MAAVRSLIELPVYFFIWSIFFGLIQIMVEELFFYSIESGDTVTSLMILGQDFYITLQSDKFVLGKE